MAMQGHPAVHPFQAMELEGQGVPAAQQPAAAAVPPADLPEVEGTKLGVFLRSVQVASCITVLAFLFSAEILAAEFRLLALAALVQFFWSLVLWLVNVYACLVMRPLRNKWMLLAIAVVDGVATIVHHISAWYSMAILLFVADDLKLCGVNNCPSYIGATSAGFVTATALVPCFLLSYWGYL